MKQKLMVSFSGGKTSAYMLWWILNNLAGKYEIIVLFANTGMENEQTLVFVQKCAESFGVEVVWLEAVVHEGLKGCTHQVVDFASASRHGEPFEAVIAKYGIPNAAYLHCNRELKLNPMKSYLASIGWKESLRAIGIRADEADRIDANAKKKRLIYPLISMTHTTKDDVELFWRRQHFTLELEEIDGNCRMCWKKSDRKLWTLAQRSPEVFDFTARMEEEHGLSGCNTDGTKRVFFRNNRSTKDIFREAKQPFEPWTPYRELQLSMFGGEIPDIDREGGCAGACDPFSDEEAA